MTCKPQEVSENEARELGWLGSEIRIQTVKKFGFTVGMYKTHSDFLERFNADQRIKLGEAKEGDELFTLHDYEVMPINLAGRGLSGIDFGDKKVMFRDGTDVKGTNFNGSKFKGIDLSGIIVDGDTRFQATDLIKATLYEATLYKTDKYDGADMRGAKICNDHGTPYEPKDSYRIIKNAMKKRGIKVTKGISPRIAQPFIKYGTTYAVVVSAALLYSKDYILQSIEPLPKDPAPSEIVTQRPPAKIKTALSLTQTETFCKNAAVRADETMDDICEDHGFTQESVEPEIQP